MNISQIIRLIVYYIGYILIGIGMPLLISFSWKDPQDICLYEWLSLVVISFIWFEVCLFIISHLYLLLYNKGYKILSIWYPLYISIGIGSVEYLFRWENICWRVAPHRDDDYKFRIILHTMIIAMTLGKTIFVYFPLLSLLNVIKGCKLGILRNEYKLYWHLYPTIFNFISGNAVCRICYDDKDEYELIGPCACSGGIQFVHTYCLNEWNEYTSNPCKCPTCQSNYHKILYT